MTKETQKFGEYLRGKRLKASLTQSALAKKLEVSQNFVTYLEKNQRKPSREILEKLANALTIPLHKLYFMAHPEVKNIVGSDQRQETPQVSEVLTALRNDPAIRERYKITDAEIDQLASLRLRGEVRNKEDYVFLLMTIRQVLK